MPGMPFTVSRGSSVVAFETLLNNANTRPLVQEALINLNGYAIAQSIYDLATKNEDSKTVAEEAFAAIGANWTTEAGRSPVEIGTLSEVEESANAVNGGMSVENKSSPGAQRGIFHLDEHWFKPGYDKFWWKHKGSSRAELIRDALLKALDLASDDLPIHLTWTCSSPTFEVSVSSVRGISEQSVENGTAKQAVAVSVIVSTPGTILTLAHLSDDKTKNAVRPIGGDPEDQYLFVQRAWRDRSPMVKGATGSSEPEPVVVQDGDIFVYGPGSWNIPDPVAQSS